MSDGQKHELTVLVQVQTAIFDNTREQYRVGNKIQTWQQIAEQITAKGNGSKWRGKQVKQWTHFNSMSFIQKFVEQTEKNYLFPFANQYELVFQKLQVFLFVLRQKILVDVLNK